MPRTVKRKTERYWDMEDFRDLPHRPGLLTSRLLIKGKKLTLTYLSQSNRISVSHIQMQFC